jgi:hypothetical protein
LGIRNKYPLTAFSDKAPAKGAFFMVIAMLETVDFFENQIKECNAQAARALENFGGAWPIAGSGCYGPKTLTTVLI